ncbi:UNVERIFIED_CONTAM: hypothetical protein NCL1_22123 [Trichonephila clavipes]
MAASNFPSVSIDSIASLITSLSDRSSKIIFSLEKTLLAVFSNTVSVRKDYLFAAAPAFRNFSSTNNKLLLCCGFAISGGTKDGAFLAKVFISRNGS